MKEEAHFYVIHINFGKIFDNNDTNGIFHTSLFLLMAHVERHLLLVREVWSSNPEPIKSPTCCQRLANAATLMCGPWRKTVEMGTAHS